jgi:hypothetical protein
MTKTFSVDQISPHFAKDNPRFGRAFATYRFYEKECWDGKKMLMIEIKLSDEYYSDDGKIIPDDLR